jgi:hypothetical protein
MCASVPYVLHAAQETRACLYSSDFVEMSGVIRAWISHYLLAVNRAELYMPLVGLAQSEDLVKRF